MNLVFAVLGFPVILIELHEGQQLGVVRLVLQDEDAVVLFPVAEHRGPVDGAQRIEPYDLYQGIELLALVPANFFEDGGTDFRGPEGIQIQMYHELGVVRDIGLVNFCRLASGN